MDKLRLRSESGFTLIELLVVVAIIGILAAIAIPQFAAYRRRGFAAQANSDIRNMAVAQEAYFAQVQSYAGSTCDSNPDVTACTNAARHTGFNQASRGVDLRVTVPGAGGAGTFDIAVTHGQCGTDAWAYRSDVGTIVPTAGDGGCI